jgi:hypothetical protein
MSQPAPIKNDHPLVWDLVLEDLENNGANLPKGEMFSELYGAAAKLALFLKAAKDGIADAPTLMDEIRKDITDRNAFGIAKYGVGLQPFNGRDSAQDSYEEVLDLVAYLRQKVYEVENLPANS